MQQKDIYIGRARVRVTARGLSRFMDISATVRTALAGTEPVFDAGGRTVLDIPVEEDSCAAREMIRVGEELEVLEPASLRERVGATAKRMAGYYER